MDLIKFMMVKSRASAPLPIVKGSVMLSGLRDREAVSIVWQKDCEEVNTTMVLSYLSAHAINAFPGASVITLGEMTKIPVAGTESLLQYYDRSCGAGSPDSLGTRA